MTGHHAFSEATILFYFLFLDGAENHKMHYKVQRNELNSVFMMDKRTLIIDV